MAEPFLIGEAMTGGYGAVDILHGCTIAVEKGQIAVIVGPNGAGKSTAMKAVFGMLKLRGGPCAAGRRGHHRADPAGPRRQGHGLRAADAEHLHLDDGRGKPRDGRLPAPRRHPHDDGADLRRCSRSCSDKRRQAAGELSRRPAPAGRRGARADDPAQGADAGRADGRRQPHRDGRTLRPHHRGGAHRHLDPDGRTERAPGAGDRRQGLCPGAGRATASPTPARPCWPTPRCAAPSWGAEAMARLCLMALAALLLLPAVARAELVRLSCQIEQSCERGAACAATDTDFRARPGGGRL